MKTFWRIIAFTKPYSAFLPQYIVLTVFSILFGVLNFVLLVPLLDVLFSTVDESMYKVYAIEPDFQWSISYFKDIFYYHFYQIIKHQGKIEALKFVCITVVISVFVANFSRYFSERIIGKLRGKIVKNIRREVFSNLITLHIGFFSNERKGDIVSRITNDVQEVENSIVSTLRGIFRDPATIIFYFVVLFIMSVKFTLFSLAYMVITGVIIAEIIKRLKRSAGKSQHSLGILLEIINETVEGLRVIKAFNAQKSVLNAFDKENNKYANLVTTMSYKRDLASPLSQFLGVLAVTGLLLYGGSMVLSGNSEMKANEFIAYIVLFSQVMVPAKSFSNAISSIQRGIVAGNRVFELIDQKTKIYNAKDAVKIESFNHKIEFKNVGFRYEQNEVLKNVQLNIEKGQTVALVGPSGGGKSTLADLIPRFYDVHQGEVLIDTINIKQIELTALRDLIGVVTQESILFNDTIFNNIAFGINNITESQVIDAAKIANAHEFISHTEKGYQTEIGDRGVKLSGGQRQRLSIARAVLKNPPILILDEATSALDTESEKLVQDALNNLMKNRTSIVIAHRLSTIQNADWIVVINNGKIVEQGKHTDLMNRKELYFKLVEMQKV